MGVDLSESFFTRFSNWRRRKNKIAEDERAAFFDEEIESIQLFFSFLCPEENVLFRKSDGLGSVTDGIVFLPEKITFFKEFELNRKVYLHKALVAAIVRRHRIYFIEGWTEKKQRAFQIRALKGLIDRYLRIELDSYESFFSELFIAIKKDNYKKEKNDHVFKQWTKNCGILDSTLAGYQIISGIKSLYVENGDIHMSRLSYYPMAELMLYCSLMTTRSTEASSSDLMEMKRKSQSYETEIEGKNISGVDLKVVDLDKKKEQENPIMHSFETLHTADEYQGGYRVSDASDELADHQNALNELHLESVTRSGDQASSVYRAFIDGLIEVRDSASKQAKGLPSTCYPEWDYKKQVLKKDHCRLYFPKKSTFPELGNEKDWEIMLAEKYSSEVAKWKKKIEAVVNTEVWVNRQWSGVEVDLEAYINFRGDVARGQCKEAPLYLNQKKAITDTTCLFLFDQSFSTDSWVQNRRVLDIELEAIGLTGLLTDSFLKSVAIAGTWSETRNHCYFNLYKDFRENWSNFYQGAKEIAPQGYTRLGPSIRHAIEELSQINARQRLLVILTDGKPTDYDRYEGLYGIEDVRNAVSSAEQSGVFVKALAIEKKNTAHLEQIFGKGRYEVINDVKNFSEVLLKFLLEAMS